MQHVEIKMSDFKKKKKKNYEICIYLFFSLFPLPSSTTTLVFKVYYYCIFQSKKIAIPK